MNKKVNNKRAELARLIGGMIESVSRDREAAMEYLTEEGMDPDKIEKRMLNKIQNASSRGQIKVEQAVLKLKDKAKEMTEEIMEKSKISIKDFIKEHKLDLEFGDKSEPEENIREMLENYFEKELKNKKKNKQ